MTRIRFVWRGIGEFTLIDPITLFNFADEPYYQARYEHKGKLSKYKGDFPFKNAESIETLPDQMTLEAA